MDSADEVPEKCQGKGAPHRMHPAPISSDGPNPGENMKGKLLVVDDEDTMRNLLMRGFSDQGYHCDTAAGPAQAKEMLGSQEYDILITDKNMPAEESGSSEGGMELLHWARQQRPDTAVIVMTGYATIESAIEALQHGAADYLLKPLDMQSLVRKVERVRQMQRSINPEGVLGLYKDLMREVLEMAAEGTPGLEVKMNHLRERLDLLFQTIRNMEQILMDQRTQLAEIALCAEIASDQLVLNEAMKAVLARIAYEAGHRL